MRSRSLALRRCGLGVESVEFVAFGRDLRLLCMGFLVAYPSGRRYLFAMCSDEELYCKLLKTLSMWAPEAHAMVVTTCPSCAKSCNWAMSTCRSHPVEWMGCISFYTAT